MELNKENILKIFEKNFKYILVDTPLGKAIKMDWYEAFLFSNVTGSGYLDNAILPYSPKGMIKIFYNAFEFNFVTGLFDNTTLKNSPFNLSKSKPYLFTGDKYILIEEFNKEIDLQERLESYIEKLNGTELQSTDFIIQRVETSKNGNGMESFLEYLACEFFKTQGYIVENQIPLARNVGSPDFAGYKIKTLIDFVQKHCLFENGFHIVELALLRLKNNNNIDENKSTCESKAIVGEAKTSTEIMSAQLEKYLNTGLYSEGIELHANKKQPDKNYFSLLTINNNYEIEYKTAIEEYNPTEIKMNKNDYYDWLEIYTKFYLISNLTNDELEDFFMKKNKVKISSTIDIVKFVKSISYDEIYNEIIKE